MEISLVFASLEPSPRCYVVNDKSLSIRESTAPAHSPQHDADVSPPRHHRHHDIYASGDHHDSLWRGAASISSLQGGIGTRDAVLTTSFLPDKPRVLLLSLLSCTGTSDNLSYHTDASAASSSPVLAHLDLGSETFRFGTLVKVQAFHWNQLDRPTSIALLLFDTNAYVMRLQLNAKTLCPERSSIDFWSVGEMVTSKVGSGMVPPAMLQSSMIVPLSSSTLLMALNPFLLAVDLNHNQTVLWSKTKCLEDMKTRSSSIGKILAKGVDLILGKADHSHFVDMQPASALCVADNDPRTVFSLHSDGNIRHWTLSPNHDLEPWQMCEPVIAAASTGSTTGLPLLLPPNASWSDTDPFCVALTARIYDTTFALAIYIRAHQTPSTTLTSPFHSPARNNTVEDELQDAAAYGCSHLIVVDGPLHMEHTAEAHSVRLQVPVSTQSTLISMTFDPHNERCSLLTLFQQSPLSNHDDNNNNNNNNHAVATALYVTYPPSNLCMVSQEGIETPPDYLLDGLAQQERRRLLQLDLLDGNDSFLSLEHQLTALDQRFLQYLFRPTFPRGTGLAMPPTPIHIQRALANLVGPVRPYYGDTTTTGTPSAARAGSSMELETLRAVHAMRRKQRGMTTSTQMGYSMTPRTRHRNATPGIDMAHAENDNRMTFYDTLVETPARNDQRLVPNQDNDTDPEQPNNVQLELQSHQQIWKTLLLEIWKQEQVERLQLCMAIPAVLLDDAVASAIVVRAGSVTVLRNDHLAAQPSQPAALSVLDRVAAKVMQAMDNESLPPIGNEDKSLAAIEVKVWNAVARGALGVDETVLVNIQEKLSRLAKDKVLNDGTLSMENVLETLTKAGRNLLTLLRQDPIITSLPGISQQKVGDAVASSTVARNHGLSTQQRASSAALAILSVDWARRILLGRLLVLLVVLPMESQAEAISIVFRKYLHCVTALWTCSQRVNMRFLSDTNNSTQLPRVEKWSPTSTPPAKRLFHGNMGTTLKSILAVNGVQDKTTSIDSLLIYLADKYPNMDARAVSLLSCTTRLASQATACLLSFGGAGGHVDDTSSTGFKLPELAAIPPLSNTVTDEPKLALRLLGVSMAIPDTIDPPNVVAMRTHVFAECLLIAVSSVRYGDKADAMVAVAIDLLRFMPDDMETSMQRVKTICHHLSGKPMYEDRVKSFIMSAIDQTPPSRTGDIVQLWFSLFTTSIALGQWQTAFEASLSTPDRDKRSDCLKRLVRTMVDAGALLELVHMCASVNSDIAQSEHIDSLRNSGDLYAIAAETLAENSGRDVYSYLAVEPGPLSDYSGALFALHVSHNNWKLAAETLAMRYENARKALVDGATITDLGLDASMRREILIVQDLVLSSLGCVLAMKQVSGSSSQFLARDMGALASSLQIKRWSSDFSSGGASQDSMLMSEDETFTKQAPRFFTLEELSTRAVMNVALKKLFFDKLAVGKAFAVSTFTDVASSPREFSEFIDLLFENGYYHDGLTAAWALSKLFISKPNGRDLYADTLWHLLSAYLIPLASGQLIPEVGRPTLLQLRSAFETSSSPPELPSVLELGCRGSKISELYGAAVRTAASALVHRLTLEYSTAESPLALEVAECMLESGQLPSWLEQLLVHGFGSPDATGLFAKRPTTRDSKVYLGDPSALLSLYTKRGMYLDACRVVTSVLTSSFDSDAARKAPFRLPEKGNMDFVPYDKIDLLWNLIEISMTQRLLDKEQAKQVVAARNEMEQSLEKHFERLEISEMGLVSARALNQRG